MEYFLLKPDGEQTGTYSIEQIQAMLAEGRIGADTRYWHEGITEWRPVDRIEESLAFTPPAPAPSTTASSHLHKIPPTSRAVPPPSSKAEKSTPAPSEKKVVDLSKALRPAPPAKETRPGRTEATPEPEPSEETTHHPAVDLPRTTRTYHWPIYIFFGLILLVVLALNYLRPPPRPESVEVVQNKVTLTGGNIYVLLSPSTIKAFEDDLQNSSVASALEHQITQTTDANTLLRLKVGLETERTRHTDEVKQRYIQNGQAEFIEAGTYPLLDYLNNNGEPTAPHDGEPVWEVILYKDQTVYVLKASSSSSDALAPSTGTLSN